MSRRAKALLHVVFLVGVIIVMLWPRASNASAAFCFGRAVTLYGSTASEPIIGTVGNDVIFAGRGDDTVFGLSGRDRICGGTGDDSIDGMNGYDRVNGGRGHDSCIGELRKGCE